MVPAASWLQDVHQVHTNPIVVVRPLRTSYLCENWVYTHCLLRLKWLFTGGEGDGSRVGSRGTPDDS
jgi:hypothetical protein